MTHQSAGVDRVNSHVGLVQSASGMFECGAKGAMLTSYLEQRICIIPNADRKTAGDPDKALPAGYVGHVVCNAFDRTDRRFGAVDIGKIAESPARPIQKCIQSGSERIRS